MNCKGVGTILPPRRKRRGRPPAPIPCPECGGRKTIRHDGQIQQQDRVLEIARLVSKGAGLAVNTQINTVTAPPMGGGGVGSPLGQLQQAISTILSGPRATPSDPVVEATLVPAAPDASPERD